MHTNKFKSVNRTLTQTKNNLNNSLIIEEMTTFQLYSLLKNNPILINSKDDNQNTFLSYAIIRKNEEIIDLLLTSPVLDLSYVNNNGDTYLHLSIINHLNLDIISKLIKKGIDFNKQNLDGNSALHLAYMYNTKINDNTEIINFLINQGINVSLKNKNFKTAVELDTNPSSKIEINKSIKMNWSTGASINNHLSGENLADLRESIDFSSKENNKTFLKNENESADNNFEEEDFINMVTINCDFSDINENEDEDMIIKKNNHLSPDFIMRRKIIKSDQINNDCNSRNVISNNNELASINKNNCQTTENKQLKNSNISEKSNNVNFDVKTKKIPYKRKLMFLNSFSSNKNTDISNNNNKKFYNRDNRDNRKSENLSIKLIDVKKNTLENNEMKNICRRTNTYENKKIYSFHCSSKSDYNLKSKKSFFVKDISNKFKFNNIEFKTTQLPKNIYSSELKKLKKSLSNSKINCHTQPKKYIKNMEGNNYKQISVITDEEIKNSLYEFLLEIHMESYFDKLKTNGYDDVNLLIEQISSDNINDSELIEIGIKKPGDRAKILIRLQEKANGFTFPIPNNVYYMAEDSSFINFEKNPCINRLFEWLKEIKIENYMENFINNGYYSLDLLVVQMISKNPLTNDILKNEIGIDKLGHRSRILSKLKDEGFKLYDKLENKVFNINSNKEKDDQNICSCNIV